MRIPRPSTRNSVIVLLIVLVGVTVATSVARQTGVFDQIGLLVDVRHQIAADYVEEPDLTKLVQSGVRGMIEALDDPYTNYVSPEELTGFDRAVRGTFSGIGAEVDQHDSRLRIVTPLDDSPAYKAGIMAGDMVLEIEGKDTTDMTVPAAIKLLQGAEGTPVTLKVRHLSGDTAEIKVVRAQINVRTVRGFRRSADGHWDYMLDPANKVGFVRISQFTESTAPDLRAALDELLKKDVKAIILDLRFDPGGLLESAVEVSDLFLDAGKRIVSVKGRAVPERVQMSTQPGTIPPIPMVVLANEASASAAEIVSGAMLDNNRAEVIGTRTWGKGSVQTVRMLDGGEGAIKITTAYYYLPSGRSIHRRKNAKEWGVEPADGFWVPMTPKQIKRMIEVRRAGDVLSQENGKKQDSAVTPQWIEKELADPQLAAGLKAILGKLDTGEWPKVGLASTDALVTLAKRETLEQQREALNDRLAEVNKEIAKLDPPTTQPTTQP